MGRGVLVAGGLGLSVVLLVTAAIGGLAVIAVLGIAGGRFGCGPDGGLGGGAQSVDGVEWTGEQTENAATIVARVVERQLPRRAAVIALSTVIVESRLVNVAYGDRDSLGLYQQRPSQGWGPPARVLNPVAATDSFLDRLIALPGWHTMAPGTAAQAVQRSAFPDRYAPQEGPAAALVDQLWVGADNPVELPRGTDSSVTTNAQLAASVYACPDSGGAGVPLPTGPVDPKKLPAGFTPPADPVARAAVGYALAQLGKPYVWGGTGPDGFDCSGLMLASWAAAGVALPAGTVSQKHAGTSVRIQDIAPGDLVFIPGSLGTAGNPRHNGMYVGHGLVVNAYDTTRGVVLQPLSDWADKVTHIRRVHTPAIAPAGTPAPAVATGAAS
ncbi:C40 family peptidase [Pseudonocardia sp. ICBG1142]|uniref:C40 family peptidase n=1 Tax=Pseudonocardia sp. ICBG1142 TaxID=2846760 RepID=UPI001CF64653|nr:C40 family peptidase [Pseudonocardia sp. ICBG1142]